MSWEDVLKTLVTVVVTAVTLGLTSWFQVWVNARSRRQSVADVRRAKLEELYELVDRMQDARAAELDEVLASCASGREPERPASPQHHAARVAMLVGIYAPSLEAQFIAFMRQYERALGIVGTVRGVLASKGDVQEFPNEIRSITDQLIARATLFMRAIADEASRTLKP
jgi:hypothetical protein